MKLAPPGYATPYLTAATLATNLGAGLGPILGGLLAKFFSLQVLTLELNWAISGRNIHVGVLNLAGLSFLFVIAFIFGIFTVRLLASVREKGEVEREVVLGELLAQSRASSGGVNASPLLGITNIFPLTYLQKVPGFDVAIGVTVYQLAETARQITQKAARSRNFPLKVTKALEKQLTKLFTKEEELPSRTTEYAEQAASGAMQAAIESKHDTTSLINPAVTGIVKAMQQSKASTEDSVRGASRGIIKNAIGSGVDLIKTVHETIEAVRQAAHKYGMDEGKLVAASMQAMLSEARNNDISSEKIIRQTLSSTYGMWYDELDNGYR
jgi:hypothetical protein